MEDDEDARSVYRAILEHAGYEVEEAGDGVEGVRLALERTPDLVLTDIHMPASDGLFAARQLRDHPRTARLPIVAVTSQGLTAPDRDGFRDVFSVVLPKPVSPARLLGIVEGFLAAAVDPAPGGER